MRHYHNVFGNLESPVFDDRTLRDLGALTESIEKALPDQKAGIFEKDIEPFLKSIEVNRVEGENNE